MKKILFNIVFIIISIIIMVSFVLKLTYESGYTDACKDFYQGKLKYKLIKNYDGTIQFIENK